MSSPSPTGSTEAEVALCISCNQRKDSSQQKMLVCGRCRNVHACYCSKECQQHHWPIHRAVCSSDYEVFLSPGRGKGLRALRSFTIGEEIFREAVILRTSNQQSATTRKQAELMHARAVQASFDKLTPAKQRAVMDLAVCEQWLDANGGVATPHGVFQTNSYRLKGEDDGAIGLAQARLNHSCRPNVNHIWRSDLQKTLVFATRDVAPGEELCTTYGPSECLDTAGRRSYLQEGFSFHCLCEMCSEIDNTGDNRMVMLHDLHESLPNVVREGHHQKAIEIVDQCIELLSEQGIGSGVFTMPLLKYGYQIALMGLNDKELALTYVQKQLVAVTQCEGVGCPEALQLGLLL